MTSDRFFVEDAPAIDPLTVSIKQAQALTGHTRSTIYLMIQTGKVEAVKSGSRTLVVYATLKAYMRGLPKVKATGAPPKRKFMGLPHRRTSSSRPAA